MIGDFFRNFKEGFESVIDTAQDKVHSRIGMIESRVSRVFYKLKRKVYRGVFELLFFSISIVFLFVGLVLFLSRFFALDLVIIGFALLALYIGLMLRIMK